MRAIAAIGLAVAVATVPACDTQQDVGNEDPALGQPTTGQDQGMAADTTIPALQVDSMDGQAYLTDANGRALYILEGEPQDSSTCYDACAEEWPPYLTSAQSPTTGGEQVQEDLIGTIERSDAGTGNQVQLTYNGQPLYYYHDDTGAGDTAGQDVTDDWGEWYLVQPNGEPLENTGGNNQGN